MYTQGVGFAEAVQSITFIFTQIMIQSAARSHRAPVLALQLVDSTELQDRTISQIRDGSTTNAEDVPPEEDVDAYLWDFIETSQDLSENAEAGGASAAAS